MDKKECREKLKDVYWRMCSETDISKLEALRAEAKQYKDQYARSELEIKLQKLGISLPKVGGEQNDQHKGK